MTHDELLASLRRRAEASSQKTVARSLGISQSQFCMLLKGDRSVTPYIAGKLGYVRVVTFEARSEAK